VDIGELGYSPPRLALEDILRFGLDGHIITAMFHPRNPWTGGDSWDLTGVNVPDILPRGSRRSQWLAYLNTMADILQEASDQGIIILIRYLQEMNGYWFWWGNLTKAHYKALYRDVHKHFTRRRGLKNLLFVYSPGNSYSDEIKPYNFYFPGKKFVDLIGVTVYEDCYEGDPLEIYDYPSLVSLAGKKPLFIAELGPQTEDTLFWYWDYADSFSLYPEVVMAMAYNDWSYEGDGNWVMKSIRGNHADGVLWHETVIAKEELPASLFSNTL
jgi:Beta-mannanase